MRVMPIQFDWSNGAACQVQDHQEQLQNGILSISNDGTTVRLCCAGMLPCAEGRAHQ